MSGKKDDKQSSDQAIAVSRIPKALPVFVNMLCGSLAGSVAEVKI